MSIPVNNQILSCIQDQLLLWDSTPATTRDLRFTMEGIDVDIILNRGKNVYLEPKSRILTRLDDSMNVSSTNEKIQKLFTDYFPPTLAKNIHSLPIDDSRKFELRFFENKHVLEKRLQYENQKYAIYEKPLISSKFECNFI